MVSKFLFVYEWMIIQFNVFSIIDYDEWKFNLISVIGLEDNSLVMFPIYIVRISGHKIESTFV